MALGSGLAAQIGIGKESTVGTRVAPDHFFDFASESLTKTVARIPRRGLRNRRTHHNIVAGKTDVNGGFEVDLVADGMGLILEAAFGGVSTTGAGPYDHTFTPGNLASYTIQVGKPKTDGTVEAHDFLGCYVSDWSITFDPSSDSMVTGTFNWLGMNLDTGQSLASASYATYVDWTSLNASVTVDGNEVNARSVTLSGDNGLRQTWLSSSSTPGIATISEQNRRVYSGSITMDYNDDTERDLYLAGSQIAIVITLGSGSDDCVITTNAILDGSTPVVGGEDILAIELPFTCVSSTSDAAAITAVLTNGDSAP